VGTAHACKQQTLRCSVSAVCYSYAPAVSCDSMTPAQPHAGVNITQWGCSDSVCAERHDYYALVAFTIQRLTQDLVPSAKCHGAGCFYADLHADGCLDAQWCSLTVWWAVLCVAPHRGAANQPPLCWALLVRSAVLLTGCLTHVYLCASPECICPLPIVNRAPRSALSIIVSARWSLGTAAQGVGQRRLSAQWHACLCWW
jgi:hypothetical protein